MRRMKEAKREEERKEEGEGEKQGNEKKTNKTINKITKLSKTNQLNRRKAETRDAPRNAEAEA